jgi:hypothetical protein
MKSSLAGFAATWLALAPAAAQEHPPLPLPKLEDPVRLSVLVVSNPDLPRVGDAQVDAILRIAARGFQATFGVRIDFAPPQKQDVAALFAALPAGVVREARKDVYDFKSGRGDPARLIADMEKELRGSGSSPAELIAYAAPYLVTPPASQDIRGLADALVLTHLGRLERFRLERLEGGKPLIPAEPWNEYAFWDRLHHTPLAHDVIITNQLLASAEYNGASMHSALRGGVSNGITTECSRCRHGTFSVVSTYPFWGTDPTTTELRGGVLTEEESALAAATMLVHELGHQLLHLGHPYGLKPCVMNPVELLRFREWVAGLDEKACARTAHPTLVPGFIKFADVRRQRQP